MTGTGTRVFHTALTGIAGFIAVLAGGWFVIGAIAWPLLYNSGVIVNAPPATVLQYFVGYYGGVGCLLIFLGAFVVGRSATAQRAA